MTVINLDGVSSTPGVVLYRDEALSSPVEAIEFLSPTTSMFTISLVSGVRVDSVYEFQTGAWVLRTDARIAGNKVLLDTVPTGVIAVVPKGFLSLVQQVGKSSLPVKLYTKVLPKFIATNFSITTLDDETAAPGPVLFSLTENGTYTDSLGPIAVPSFIWIKSNASVVGLKKTTPIVTTFDLYL